MLLPLPEAVAALALVEDVRGELAAVGGAAVSVLGRASRSEASGGGRGWGRHGGGHRGCCS